MQERPPLDDNWPWALRSNPTCRLSVVVCRQSFPGHVVLAK